MNENENERYVIDDLDIFVEESRILVYNLFGEGDVEDPTELDALISAPADMSELDQLLSSSEAKTIVLEWVTKQTNRRTQKVRYVIDEADYMGCLEKLNERIVSNVVASLVSKGLVEMAFDTEENDFVFWVADDDDREAKQNPESDA